MNFLQKIWFKLNNPVAYYKYKQEKLFVKSIDFAKKINNFTEHSQKVRTFKHSGNAGDIIYALPTLSAFDTKYDFETKKDNIFYIKINEKSHYKQGHFLGNVMLDEKTAKMFVPLLEKQSYIQKVEILDQKDNQKNDQIDYDLDLFRELPLILDKGDISRWYFHVFNVFYDLSNAWLDVTPNQNFSNQIVLARSTRYQNTSINYDFLKSYKNVVFLGVENEFLEMRKNIPHLEWQKVNDFLEMAEIIAGSKLFIGNQSFPYSIAEGLKVPRILELCYYTPNVIIHGKNGYDFYFQQHFEALVKELCL